MTYPLQAAMSVRVINGINHEDLEDALVGSVDRHWLNNATTDQRREKLLELHNAGTSVDDDPD